LLAWAASAASLPVILDTDIGDDIDDTWALAMLLGMPQLDLKLIVTDYGNTPERTRLTAKILERVGRTDIPIATGIKTGDTPLTVSDWVGDFNLANYQGKVYQDGIRALVDTINAHTQTVTLITIGPVPNIQEALRRDPGITQRARVVCTGGRIYKGFENGGTPAADWNVRADPAAWQALVAAPWEITASPLDGSEEIVLRGRRFAQVAASDHPLARPELVREVLAGDRHEARASWWGFDARDSTKYLQQAINSRAKRLIIDRQPSAWVTRPLLGVSHQEIIFEAGVELVALKGAYRAKGDCLLTFQECGHVTIRGEKEDGGKSARLRMHKEDYQSGAYEKSEWRHGLAFLGCQDVLVQDLAIERTGGDGIYLGTTQGKNLNRNVVIRRVDCDANHRQGISVICAENLLIEDCLLRNTRGTAPQAGIDFEPNHPTEALVNCVMRRCVAESNAGTGYQISLERLNSGSRPISIHLDQCVSRANRQHAIHLCSAPKDPSVGRLRITRFLAEEDGMAGLSVQFNPHDAVRIELEDSVLRDCARTDAFFPPLYVQGREADNRPAGNLHFKNVTVKDDRDRSILKIRDRNGQGVKAITGEIILERQERRETIAIDDAWLKTMRE